MSDKPINTMGIGMHPLNHCSRLVKAASDVMFSVAVNDASSAELRLEALQNILKELRHSIKEAQS